MWFTDEVAYICNDRTTFHFLGVLFGENSFNVYMIAKVGHQDYVQLK
jgi:hypothetical protein